MNVNTIGPILLISQLLKRKIIQKNSSIVLIASMSGVCVGNTGEVAYGATNAALSGYAKTVAFELASQGIRVNTICPGLVPIEILNLSNEMFSEEQLMEKMSGRYPLKRFGTPEDIAHGAIYLLSDASTWVSGINLVIDGGYTIIKKDESFY
jgi:NAD(P)-dependent dehydrogenase (short-subunit alcohol dehydrogenase family)